VQQQLIKSRREEAQLMRRLAVRFQEHTMAAKTMILFLLPFNQPPLKGSNAHYQFKDDLQDIKSDKNFFCQT